MVNTHDTKQTVVFIIAAYNSERTICRAIYSSLEQVGIIPVVLVIDHGSNDNTLKIIESNFNKDKRVTIIKLKRIKNEIRSASRPLNTGFRHALDFPPIKKNFWILRLDSDDVLASKSVIKELLKDNLSKDLISGLLIFYSLNPGQAFLYGTKTKFRTVNKLIAGGAYAVAHHSTLMKNSLLNQVLEDDGYIYSESLSYGEDLDLTLRLVKYCNNSEIVFMDNPIIYKFRGKSTITSDLDKTKIWQNHLVIFNKHKELSKILLLRVGIDLCLRSNNLMIKMLRNLIGYPAMMVGFELPVNYSLVKNRITDFTK